MAIRLTEKHLDLDSEEVEESFVGIKMVPFPSDADLQMLRERNVNPENLADDFYDYSTVVVRKPWGYEYLMSQNSSVAVWILYIKPGNQTSLHCHPTKKTSLIVLSGKAECSLINSSEALRPGQGLLIGKGVFHRTRALSDDGIYVMEMESPVNKRDLVRYLDDYGRESLGYENEDNFCFNTANFNYLSLIAPDIYYNVKKHFGSCSIELVKLSNTRLLQELLEEPDWEILAIQKGTIRNINGKEILFEPGDSVSRRTLLDSKGIALHSELEAIVIRTVDTTKRLSDFVVGSLKDNGVKHVFFVPESINAHLTDAVGRDTEMVSVGMRTETGATLAAEGYSKLTGRPGVVFVSSGASGISALSGVANSFVDSTPLLVISGQSRPSKLGLPGTNGLRQLANKEIDIVKIATSLSCYAKTICEPKEIKRELGYVFEAMTCLRPTPAWLDIPLDILGMTVDEQEMLPQSTTKNNSPAITLDDDIIVQLAKMFKEASRPVILAGQGTRLSGAVELLRAVAIKHQIPILTSRRGIDLVEDDFPLFVGRPGTYGQRSANFIIQNCDLLISVGCRLSFPLVGRNYQAFARGSRKVIVDIDDAELSKATINPDLAINCTASIFLSELLKLDLQIAGSTKPWIQKCKSWRSSFSPDKEGYEDSTSGINPYKFILQLSRQLPESSTVVVDGGSSLDYVMQTFFVKSGMRVISSPGLEQSGFALPASIGACVGQNGKRVFCICERKGLELCVTEIETIVANRLPIIILLLNSSGDIGTKRVQSDYFGKRFVGATNQSATSYLNTEALGALYDIPVYSLTSSEDLSPNMELLVSLRKPALFDIRLPEQFELKPRLLLSVTSDGRWISKPLEDMYPFLSREELKKNMLIPLVDE